MTLLRKIRNLVGNEKGSVLPLVGGSMFALMGVTAFAVDLGNGFVNGTRLQGAADAAAMAGAMELPSSSSAQTAAVNYAQSNMPVNTYGNVLAGSDVEVGTWDGDDFTLGGSTPNAVRVRTRRSQQNNNAVPTFFGGVFGFNTIDVERTAIAISLETSTPCVLTLKPNGTALSLNSRSNILTDGCDVHVNSSGNRAIETNSSSGVETTNSEICVVGRARGSGYSPAPRTGCEVLDDPFASLPNPDRSGGCDHSDTVVIDSVATLYPGRYCKGIEVNSGGFATFEPGLYIIEGSKFIANSDSTMVGDGVTFYMHDKDALINANSDSTMQFTAPTSGDYAGVVFYVNRNINDSGKHEINSDSDTFIEGAVYIPSMELMINSDSRIGDSGRCAQYVVYELNLNSDSDLYVDGTACDGASSSSSGSVTLVR